MKKKLVTILCVTTITASMLAGCGSKTAETTAPTETTAVTETAKQLPKRQQPRRLLKQQSSYGSRR